MHEGLLIISKTSNACMFCNNPAQKLLRGALEYFESIKKKKIDITQKDNKTGTIENAKSRVLSSKFLKATKMAIKGQTKKFEDMINRNESTTFSLEEIILAQVDEPSQKTCIY